MSLFRDQPSGALIGGPRWPKAFTLVELLIILVLIAAVSGGLVVSLRGRQSTHALHVTAKELTAAIRFAVAEAKMRRCPHRVVFSHELRAYRVEAVVPGETLGFMPVSGQAGIIRFLPNGIRITKACSDTDEIDLLTAGLAFDGSGGGFFGQIELQNQSGEAIRIEVMYETQQIRIIEESPPETTSMRGIHLAGGPRRNDHHCSGTDWDYAGVFLEFAHRDASVPFAGSSGAGTEGTGTGGMFIGEHTGSQEGFV